MGGFYQWLGDCLSLYVKQLAWLHAAPEPPKPPKGSNPPAPEPISRLDKMLDEGKSPIFPDNPASYLSDWLFDIGPSVAGGMGEAPIGYRDMQAWSEITGVELLPWEARILRRLSGAYLAQKNDARKADCPAPYTGEDEAPRDKVTDQFAAMFKSLARKKP